VKHFLALLAFLHTAGVPAARVAIPGPDAVTLNAVLVPPDGGAARGPAVVALHGCGGPFPARDGPWAEALAKQGHLVLLPDSFGSRGLGPQCGIKMSARTVTPAGLRRQDAIATARWLAARPGTPPGGVVLLGWSNGGGTVLATARAAADLPTGLFRRFVAFYPGCRRPLADTSWRPAAPTLILIGEADDWTPAAPCHALAARFPHLITLVTYPGAYHEFDALNRPVKVRGRAATAHGGHAHAGTNPEARADAFARVPAWIDAP
jgi:dienelactone hydrolase